MEGLTIDNCSRNSPTVCKRAASSPRDPNFHTTQQHNGATESNPASLQQPPAAATASTALPKSLVASGTTSHHITIRSSGWRARILLWVCCAPIHKRIRTIQFCNWMIFGMKIRLQQELQQYKIEIHVVQPVLMLSNPCASMSSIFCLHPWGTPMDMSILPSGECHDPSSPRHGLAPKTRR